MTLDQLMIMLTANHNLAGCILTIGNGIVDGKDPYSEFTAQLKNLHRETKTARVVFEEVWEQNNLSGPPPAIRP